MKSDLIDNVQDNASMAFLCVKAATTKLQGLAVENRQQFASRTGDTVLHAMPKNSAMKALLFLDHASKKALLTYDNSKRCMGSVSLADLREGLATSLNSAIQKALSMCGLEDQDNSVTCMARDVIEERQKNIQDEILGLESAIIIPENKFLKLHQCITKLRNLEEDLDFHAR